MDVHYIYLSFCANKTVADDVMMFLKNVLDIWMW